MTFTAWSRRYRSATLTSAGETISGQAATDQEAVSRITAESLRDRAAWPRPDAVLVTERSGARRIVKLEGNTDDAT